MPTPTRYPAGISFSRQGSLMGDFPYPEISRVHRFFNDFDTYLASDWTVTVVGTGTRALTAGDGGFLLLTNSAAAGDAQWFQVPVITFLPEIGKKLAFKARFQTSNATNTIMMFGIHAINTLPLTENRGIFFKKNGGAATIDAYCGDSGGNNQTLTAVATLSNNTLATVRFAYNGRDSVSYFVNDIAVGSIPQSRLPTAGCSVSFGLQNLGAVAHTMSIDYILAMKER